MPFISPKSVWITNFTCFWPVLAPWPLLDTFIIRIRIKERNAIFFMVEGFICYIPDKINEKYSPEINERKGFYVFLKSISCRAVHRHLFLRAEPDVHF